MKLTIEAVRAAFDNAMNYNQIAAVILFGGDRGSCCDVSIVARDDNGDFLGAATLSLRGEDEHGRPELVGIYVAPSTRKKGVARALTCESLSWFKSQGAPSPVRVFCLTPISAHLFQSMGSAFDAHVVGLLPELQALMLEADHSNTKV